MKKFAKFVSSALAAAMILPAAAPMAVSADEPRNIVIGLWWEKH